MSETASGGQNYKIFKNIVVWMYTIKFKNVFVTDRTTSIWPFSSPSMPFSYTYAVRNKKWPRTFYRSTFTYSGRLPKLLTTIKMLMQRTLVNDKSCRRRISSSKSDRSGGDGIRDTLARWHIFTFFHFYTLGLLNINRCPINTCDGGPASVVS